MVAHDLPGRLAARHGGGDVRLGHHVEDGIARRPQHQRDAEHAERDRRQDHGPEVSPGIDQQRLETADGKAH